MQLVLGVIDFPYVDEGGGIEQIKRVAAATKKGKVVKPRKGFAAVKETTGEVAKRLESTYKIMQQFYKLHEAEIRKEMIYSLTESITDLNNGAPVTGFPLQEMTDKVKVMFSKFLDNEEMAKTGTPGVPTKAALAGVNHRLKLKKGDRRPSFIDTGTYQAAFKCWIE